MGWYTDGASKVSGSILDPAGLTNYMMGNKSGQRAARDAAAIQTDYGEKSLGLQKDVYDDNSKNFDPYVQGGQQDYQNLRQQTNAGAFDNPAFNPTDPGDYKGPEAYKDPGFNLTDLMNDPGYKFRLAQGLGAVQNSAAANGMLHGGNTIAGLNDYAQGTASAEVNNAFSRYANQRDFRQGQYQDARNFGADQFKGNRDFRYGMQGDIYNSGVQARQAKFNNLSAMAGYGPAAVTARANLGQNYANQAGTTLEGIGNAKASGLVGAANAKTGAAQQILGLGGSILGAYATKGASAKGGAK